MLYQVKSYLQIKLIKTQSDLDWGTTEGRLKSYTIFAIF